MSYCSTCGHCYQECFSKHSCNRNAYQRERRQRQKDHEEQERIKEAFKEARIEERAKARELAEKQRLEQEKIDMFNAAVEAARQDERAKAQELIAKERLALDQRRIDDVIRHVAREKAIKEFVAPLQADIASIKRDVELAAISTEIIELQGQQMHDDIKEQSRCMKEMHDDVKQIRDILSSFVTHFDYVLDELQRHVKLARQSITPEWLDNFGSSLIAPGHRQAFELLSGRQHIIQYPTEMTKQIIAPVLDEKRSRFALLLA